MVRVPSAMDLPQYAKTMSGFDFENTSFMDSSGIGIIIGRYRKISSLGGRVYAIHADERIQRILKASGMSSIIEVLL